MPLLKRGSIRLVQSVPFVAGARSNAVNITPGNRFIKRLWIFIKAAILDTGGAGAGTAVQDGAARLAKLFEVYVDGKPYKVGLPASFFHIAQRYDQTSGVNVGVTNFAAAGTSNIVVLIPLSFEAQSSVAPTDTLLDGRFIDTIQFFVTWDNPNTAGVLASGQDGVLSVTSGQADVYIEDTEPFPIKNPFWIQREIETQLDGVVTSTGTRMILPVTPGSVLRAILLQSTDDGLAGSVSDTVINKVTIRVNGNEKPVDTIGADFERAHATHIFGNTNFVRPTAALASGADAATPRGWYHLELAEAGRVASTGLGGSGTGVRLNSLDLIMDTTVGAGTTHVLAHTVEHLPPGVI